MGQCASRDVGRGAADLSYQLLEGRRDARAEETHIPYSLGGTGGIGNPTDETIQKREMGDREHVEVAD